MSVTTKLRALDREVGELLTRHERGRDLSEFGAYSSDPVGFMRDVLGADPWTGQVDVAEALERQRYVSVRSGNGIGKDWLAARLALWWVYARGGLVLLTGPTQRQVREIVMGEVRGAFQAVGDLPGELYEGALRVDRSGKVGILAVTSSEASRLTGFHAPRLMVVITEAQGVEGFTWEAMLSCATGENSRILAVGNPLAPEGAFYTTSRSPEWKAFRFSAFDHPNLKEGREVIPGGPSPEFVKTVESMYGRQSPVYRARVEGEFPESAVDSLLPRSWLEASAESEHRASTKKKHEDDRLVVALDPARLGPDSSAVAAARGGYVEDVVAWPGAAETTTTLGRLSMLLRKLRARGATLAVDEPGVGGPLVDSVREKLSGESANVNWTRAVRHVEAFNGGRRAKQRSRFANLRAEAYWSLREGLEAGEVSLPDDEKLFEELSAMRWSVNSAGKVKIEAKDDLRAVLGRSPDRADAVVMALWYSRQATGPVAAMVYI